MFRRAALENGGQLLNEARTSAERFREEIEAQLRGQVFDAMETLAAGFLRHNDNALTVQDLTDIFNNTLILLYRILFVLNAEARGLLPTHSQWVPDAGSPYYRSYGLELVRRKLADVNTAAEYHDDGTFALWGRFEGLFALINGEEGDRNERLGVPRYNGGLFDPARYPFLKQKKVADAYLAAALQTLTFRKEAGGVIVAFDYAGLGERHLGSIYEGLLEHRLVVGVGGQGIRLLNDKGERKTSGAYYTPQDWVAYIVAATLTPLLTRVEGLPAVQNLEPDAFATAVLNLNVCDPAMGSGHFLVEATRFFADAIAAHPSTVTGDTNYWKRRVVEACIYGVDRNPLAVELAKLSLWLATVDRVPLNFLDHHLRCGNSLVGTNLADLPRFPDPKKKTIARKKNLRQQENNVQLSLAFAADLNAALREAIVGIHAIESVATDTHSTAKEKERRWKALATDVLPRFLDVADVWTAPYFGADVSFVTFLNCTDDPTTAQKTRNAYAGVLDAVAPFHWELAFPDVFFTETGNPKPDPGFDAVIGNPPWERVKLAENEFFSARSPEIASATRAADRKTLIAQLPQTDPALWHEFQAAKTFAEQTAAFLQRSGFYPLMGVGDTNLYAVFVEKATQIAAKNGRVGLLVPSGIATDQTTSAFFRRVVTQGRLAELLDFENKAGAFPDVDSRFKFSIIVLSGAHDPQPAANCGFFLHSIDDTHDPERTFPLSPSDFATFNPNTLTCPIFRRRRDMELTRKIYQRAPILLLRSNPIAPATPPLTIANPPIAIANPPVSSGDVIGQSGDRQLPSGDLQGQSAGSVGQSATSPAPSGGIVGKSGDVTGESATAPVFYKTSDPNPWGVRFLRMFDMTNDSGKFKTYKELDADGFWLGDGNVMTKGKVRYLPLYEGKYVWHYDHRFNNGVMEDTRLIGRQASESVTLEEKKDVDFAIMPRFWIPAGNTRQDEAYLIGFRDITNVTNARTVVVSYLPSYGAGHKLPLLFVAAELPGYCLVANLNSFALDYVARNKIGGSNLTYFILEQFPVLPPSRYTALLPDGDGATYADFIRVRVLELVYTAHDMEPFARALGFAGEPFVWDEERRLHLRCQLDALYFLLYGLDAGETGEILDTFPIVRRQDEAKYTTFRTKTLILNYRKAYAAGNWDAKVRG